MNRTTKIEIAVVVLSLGAIGALRQQVFGGVLYAAGRTKGCPWESVGPALELFTRQERVGKEIEAASRLVRREPQGLEQWSTPDGDVWTPPGNATAAFYDMAEQRRDIYRDGEVGVKAGDVVLDCGANIGLFSRKALAAGASQVIAIEPAPDNLECLRRNLKEEIAAGKVVVYPKGVWDKDDVLEMQLDPKNTAAHSFVITREGSQGVMRLPLTTIDRMVTELGLGRVDFIKMDIEGAERRAVAGAQETIHRFRPRMALCVYHLPDDPQAIPAAVARAGQTYQRKCGPCEPGTDRFVPEVYFFF